METVKTYLLTILVVAIICGFINRLVKNKAHGAVVRIVMILVVLQPFRGPVFYLWKGFSFDVEEQILAAREQGEAERQKALSQLIQEDTTAYILRQAKTLHANITVEVILSDESMPVPEYVRISGNIAPYAKQQLINIIERELGVAEENQLWK